MDLTIGIELEFLLGYFRDPRMRDYLAHLKANGETHMKIGAEERKEKNKERFKIVQRLQEVGISTNDDIVPPHARIDTTRWSVSSDPTIATTEEEETTLKPMWASGKHMNLTHEGRKALIYADVEIKSRVLPYNADSLREIEEVVQTVVTSFNVTVNYTCGLHVHVGNQTFGFPLQTLKNFTTLVSCFENQFNQFHPRHRLESIQCFRPTATFELHERKPWRMAQIIDNFDTIEGLLHHFSTIHDDEEILTNYWCYNFLNLLHRPDRNTIEFRQHQGTLDAAEILRWTALVCSVVELTHDLQAEAFWKLVLDWTGHESDPKWDVYKLLEDLHLDVLCEAFEDQCYEHSSLNPLNSRGGSKDRGELDNDDSMESSDS